MLKLESSEGGKAAAGQSDLVCLEQKKHPGLCEKCGFVWCCYLFDDLIFLNLKISPQDLFFSGISLGILGRRVFNILGQQKETQHRSLQSSTRRVDIGGAKAEAMAMNGGRDDLNFPTNWGAF